MCNFFLLILTKNASFGALFIRCCVRSYQQTPSYASQKLTSFVCNALIKPNVQGSLREDAKKGSFFSVPTTKTPGPPTLGLVVIRNFFFLRPQIKKNVKKSSFFLSGQALPSPPSKWSAH